MFYKNKKNILTKKMFITDLGKLYKPYSKVKIFLIKELYVKPNGILSLQKHNHRSEHWL